GRTAHDELAFALKASADILRHDDVVLEAPTLRHGKAPVGGLGGGYAVRGPLNEERQRALWIFRSDDGGLEANPVAHRDHDFAIVHVYPGILGLAAEEQSAGRDPYQERR